MSTNGGVDKEEVVMYTMECYSAIEKSESVPFVTTWMDLEIVILSEVTQTEKDRYPNIFHSNPKEGKCQRMFKLLYNCAHFTR